MIITTLKDIYDCFWFYPDIIHYFIESKNIRGSVCKEDEIQDFIEREGHRMLKNVFILLDGSDIVLSVTIK